MKILNGYAGLGGNRKLWPAEHQVVAVEKNPQIAAVYKKLNPKDEIIVGDAHKFLLENFHLFDFVWLSPPCQRNSKMIISGQNHKPKYPDFRLYQEVIFLRQFFKGKFVVENVNPYYTPLITPTRIIGRHLFWSNFNLGNFEIKSYPNFIKQDTIEGAERLKQWLGIHYEGTIYYKGNHNPGQVLKNCVHPDVGLHILNAAIGVMTKENTTQTQINFNQ